MGLVELHPLGVLEVVDVVVVAEALKLATVGLACAPDVAQRLLTCKDIEDDIDIDDDIDVYIDDENDIDIDTDDDTDNNIDVDIDKDIDKDIDIDADRCPD